MCYHIWIPTNSSILEDTNGQKYIAWDAKCIKCKLHVVVTDQQLYKMTIRGMTGYTNPIGPFKGV